MSPIGAMSSIGAGHEVTGASADRDGGSVVSRYGGATEGASTLGTKRPRDAPENVSTELGQTVAGSSSSESPLQPQAAVGSAAILTRTAPASPGGERAAKFRKTSE